VPNNQLLIIAGSGPSAVGYPHANVCTKKHTVPADYLALRHIKERDERPLLLYKWDEPERFPEKQGNLFKANHEYWDEYYRSFDPKFPDPTSGTCAIFCVMEKWKPEKIGLIGFDWVLDKNLDWFHDAVAEYKAITQLVEIIDLRTTNDYTSIRWL
jgi:hypothetical protein